MKSIPSSRKLSQMKFQENDGGRSEAGLEPTHGACAVRAIAIATGLPYQQVWDELYAACKKDNPQHQGTAVPEPPLRKYMDSMGWHWQELGLSLSLDQLPQEGTFVAMIPGHLATVIDGVFHDTLDKSDEGRAKMYGYFFKAE